jgi:hypothetical protein
MGRNCSFPHSGGNPVQQLPYPASMSPICSCRPERSLTPLAPDVRGAAPLPAFPHSLLGAALVASEITWASSRRNPEASHGIGTDKQFSVLLTLRFAGSGARSVTRIQVGEERFTPPLHYTLSDILHPFEPVKHRKQSKIYPERAFTRIADKTSDEAGATPPFDARCVTVPVGSLPPHQFSELRNLLGSPDSSNLHCAFGDVHG